MDNNLPEPSGAIKFVSTITGFVIRIFLAVTTAGFFATFGTDLWTWILPPSLASIAAAITGVILIDMLAAVWSFLNRSGADTKEQEEYSSVAMWFDMILSVLITAVYVILTTPLLISSVTAETYALLVNLSSWLGIIIGVLAFVGNGLLWHMYSTNSSQATKQKNTNALRIEAIKAQFQVEFEHMKLETAKTISGIQSQLGSLTDMSAAANTENWLRRRFSHLQQDDVDQQPLVFPMDSRPGQQNNSSNSNGSDFPLT